MKEDLEIEAEKIEQDPTVRRELNRTGGRIKQTVTRTADKFLIGTHAVLLLALGAFYFLLRLHKPLDPLVLTERLIREHGVAVIPGTAFGIHEGCYLRVAYGALQKDSAAEGIGRLVRGLKALAA